MILEDIIKIDLRICGKVPFQCFDTNKKNLTLARIFPRNIYLNLLGGAHF